MEQEKITLTPDIMERFKRYKNQPDNGAWGSLHIVLDDGNFKDKSVSFCLEYAKSKNDEEGVELAKLLLQMSQTQRSKIYKNI